jgi:AAHS family 3-hydroxyphenylpropionic acid transporter
MASTTAAERRTGEAVTAAALTLGLCFLTATIEGIDLQSMGLAAAKMRAEFSLAPEQLGSVLAASPIGLFFGAFLGGWMADLWGRKRALLVSMVVFGLFQLSTVWAPGYGALATIRFICGLGLGGALPNLIALTSEATGGKNSILNVVVTSAGMPVGGALASAIVFAEGAKADWRLIFYVGGLAPLAVAGLMAAFLPESRLFREARAAAVQAGRGINPLQVLFGGGRFAASAVLWIAFFGTTLVTYLLLNWLPILMQAKGFSASDAAFIQILFNLGSAVGAVLIGWWMQRRPGRLVLLVCYVGLALGLVALARTGASLAVAAVVIALTGTFLLGGLYILYGLSPAFYPREARGTGAGAAVAVGRIGSAVGPALAGVLVAGGKSATQVLQAMLPVVAVSAVAALLLMFCRRSED